MKKIAKNAVLYLGGFAAGFVNALLGAGGGMLAVPTLKSSGLCQKDAHANAVAVILPLSFASAVMYMYSGHVNFTDALKYMPWGLAGALSGTYLLNRLPDKWLRRIFAVFMIWAGIRTFMR